MSAIFFFMKYKNSTAVIAGGKKKSLNKSIDLSVPDFGF